MKIISEFVEVDAKTLYVPWYQRISPNISSGSYLQCVLIEPEEQTGAPPEIFASQFPKSGWGDIWSISILFYDEPGIFNKVTEIFGSRDARINVLTTEIMPVHSGYAYIHFVADLSGYGQCSTVDGSSADRRDSQSPVLEFLTDCLIAEMLEKIVLRDGEPQIDARRLDELHAIGTSMTDDASSHFTSQIDNGLLKVRSDSIWERFVDNASRSVDGNYQILVTSDTEQGYIRFIAVPARYHYFTLAITMSDHSGQLRRCTSLLEELKLNIITAYQDLESAGGKAVWRALMESASEDDFQTLKRQIEEKFDQSDLKREDARFKLEFPPPHSPQDDPHLRASRELRNAIFTLGRQRFAADPDESCRRFLEQTTSIKKLQELIGVIQYVGSWQALQEN